MAGMFYSLEEIADKFGGDTEKAQDFVAEHKLREFRDGTRVVYKSAEVDAAIAEPSGDVTDDLVDIVTEEEAPLELTADEEAPVELIADESSIDLTADDEDEAVELVAEEDSPVDLDITPPAGDMSTLGLAPDESTMPAASLTDDAGSDDSFDLSLDESAAAPLLGDDDSVSGLFADDSEMDLGGLGGDDGASDDSINALLGDDSAPSLEPELDAPLDDAPLGSAADIISDLTAADTQGANTGINVLGESDAEFDLSTDSKSETQDLDIEDDLGDLGDDINLDTVGSGSGLLDLSLQADDTSLGAVLDDILPATEEAEAPMPMGDDFGGDDADNGAAVFEAPAAATPMGGASAAARYIETPPDTSSNLLGVLLLLPLLGVIYGIIVVANAMQDVSASVLDIAGESLWMVLLGLAGACGLFGIIFALMGGESKPKTKKAKKAKAPKAKKAKKEKKKKEKKPKKAKKSKKK